MLVRDELVPTQVQRTPSAYILAALPPDRPLVKCDLVVQEIAYGAVELGGVRPLKHHLQVVALLPVRLAAQLLLYDLMEFRARKRIGDTYPHILRAGVVQQPAGGKHVHELLAEIAELDEKP